MFQKKSFFNRQMTAVTALFHGSSIEELLARARTAEFEGADGIAVDLCRLPPEKRTIDNFRLLMNGVRLPFMFLDYRTDQWFGEDDAGRQDCLLLAAEAGAEVIDVMGDLYAPAPGEMTQDKEAIARQQRLIADIHERGAKALISCHRHTLPACTASETVAIMKAQRARGADICKIVTAVNSEEELLEALRATMALNRELDVPFIHLSNGAFSRLHRYMGTRLGVGITFALTGYDAIQCGNQPTIRSFKAVMENLHWSIGDLCQ